MVKCLAAAVLFCLGLSIGTCFSPADVNTLKQRLLNRYDTSTNPITNSSFINVDIAIRISSIGGVDETSEKFTTVLIISTAWTDELLQWNITENGITEIQMQHDKVWVPELKIFNKHHESSSDDGDRVKMPVLYAYTGRAAYIQVVTAETVCALDTWHFPFDHHTCSIDLAVNKWRIHMTNLSEEFDLRQYEPDGSWDIIDVDIIGMTTGLFRTNITIIRKPTYILVNIVLPITIIAFLSPIVFLLPNKSGERVGFSITTLLAISLYMTIVADHIPNKSNPIPLLSSLLFVAYALTAFVVVVVVVNARIYRLPHNVTIPRFLLHLLVATKCCCRCFKRRNVQLVKHQEEDEDEDRALKGDDATVLDSNLVTWKDISWAIDMFFMFLIYLVKVVLMVVFWSN